MLDAQTCRKHASMPAQTPNAGLGEVVIAAEARKAEHVRRRRKRGKRTILLRDGNGSAVQINDDLNEVIAVHEIAQIL